jgi:protein-L-isoaspartate(D-aspartate) O-methyltransferase
MKQRRFSEAAQAIGVKDERILRALDELPREMFVGAKYERQAQMDWPIALGFEVTTSQPSLVGYMVELLALDKSKRVLEIGTGTGYQAALLAQLSQEVVTVERIGALAKRARAILKELEIVNVTVITGDGNDGYPEKMPYQAIIMTAAAETVPRALIEQLDEGGVLVYPKQERGFQRVMKGQKIEGLMSWEEHMKVLFVPLEPGVV